MNLRRGLWWCLPVAACFAVTGCVTNNPTVEVPPRSPLEVRAIETRTYEGLDVKKTVKAVFNVLQDEDFLVDYGNTDLGLLHATKSVSDVAAISLTPGSPAPPAPPTPRPRLNLLPTTTNPRTIVIEATANISEFGDRVRVRVNFQAKISYPIYYSVGYGGLSESFQTVTMPITDAAFFQTFFAKVDRGLFIQKQEL